MITAREQFCAVVSSGPLLRADAIVVLAGQDGEARLATAGGLLEGGGAPVVVLSGGINHPPRELSAEALAPLLLGRGVAPSKVIMERQSQNTHEQAVNVLALARENEWKRLLLVASPYHCYRAMLTFIASLIGGGLHEQIQLVNVPCADVPWFGEPDGIHVTRLALLAEEFDKIERYRSDGDVASYEDGLAYLKFWEGK